MSPLDAIKDDLKARERAVEDKESEIKEEKKRQDFKQSLLAEAQARICDKESELDEREAEIASKWSKVTEAETFSAENSRLLADKWQEFRILESKREKEHEEKLGLLSLREEKLARDREFNEKERLRLWSERKEVDSKRLSLRQAMEELRKRHVNP